MKETIIKCPKCGAEYHLSEIFYPYSLTGKAVKLVKDEEAGKIIHIEEEEPSYSETYCCDKCGCNFKVTAKVEVKVEEDKEADFTEEF